MGAVDEFEDECVGARSQDLVGSRRLDEDSSGTHPLPRRVNRRSWASGVGSLLESGMMAPMASRRFSTTVQHLAADPVAAVELVERLDDQTIAHLAAALRDEARRRAVAAGDHDALIEVAFEQAFGRDGLGVGPWIDGRVVVCPGSIVARSRTNHRCRFVSVDDVWIWDSGDLLREEKRSHPGREDGFKAVALLPVIEGMGLDLVTGRARAGRHAVEAVVSYEVRSGELVEVGRRTVSARGMQ